MTSRGQDFPTGRRGRQPTRPAESALRRLRILGRSGRPPRRSIPSSLPSIFFHRHLPKFRQIAPIDRGIEEPPEEWAAPATAGPCPKALAQLSHTSWTLHSKETLNLTACHVETKADFVVRLHDFFPWSLSIYGSIHGPILDPLPVAARYLTPGRTREGRPARRPCGGSSARNQG